MIPLYGYRIQMNSQMKRCIGWGVGGCQAQKLLSPWSWKASPSRCGCIHPSGSSFELHTIGILRRLFHISIINHQFHFQPLPSPENGEWSWKFQASNYGLVFLVSHHHHPKAMLGAHPQLPFSSDHSQSWDWAPGWALQQVWSPPEILSLPLPCSCVCTLSLSK